MLTIIKEDIGKEFDLEPTKKTKIILSDTNRRYNNYLQMLKYRRNKSYIKIPHYIIKKDGNVLSIMDDMLPTSIFNNPVIDNSAISIVLENLGGLNKNTITGILHNWIGEPYRQTPFIKKWRNKIYWDSYTENQMDSVFQLIHLLTEKHNIPKITTNNNAFSNNVINFEGIMYKSNFSNIYTDINPSFKFDRIIFNN